MSKLSKWWRGLAEGAVRRRHGALASLSDPYADLTRLLEGVAVRGMVDAGAAGGTVSRELARRFPGVPLLTIDPNPDRRADLQRLGEGVPAVRYRPVALGREPGRLAFHRTADPDGASLLAPSANRAGRPRVDVVGVEEVDVVALDDLCAREGVEPTIVKMDLQGNERDAILGAERSLREHARAVLIEALFEPMYEGAAPFGELDGMLRERGFGFFQLYEPVSDPAGRLMWADAMYLRARD